MTLLIVISAILAALFLVWAVRFRYPRFEAPQVLCYHKLSDRFCLEGTWTTPSRFLGHVEFLRDRGYRFIGEDEYLATLEGGARGESDASATRAGDEDRRLLLTFDDCYSHLTAVVVNELAPRGIPVLVFAISDYIGRDNTWDLSLGRAPSRHASKEEMLAMAAAGAAFGSHGASHRDLTRVRMETLQRELDESKMRLEGVVQTEIRTISYPFGRCNARVRDAARAAGYRAGFSLYPPTANRTVDPFRLRRNGVYVIDDRRTIERKLEPGPLYWFEEMKCRCINSVALLTPLLKRYPAGRGT